MDLKINIAEDAELRKYIKTLINGAVKNIVRDEITEEVRNTLKTVIEKSLNEYLLKSILKDVVTNVVTQRFESDMSGHGVSFSWNREVVGLKKIVEESLVNKVTTALEKFDLNEISSLVKKEMIAQISQKL